MINLAGEEETLRNHISKYFKDIHNKYNKDKMFFFYFQLVLMDIFLQTVGKTMNRQDLKIRLMEVLKNECLIENNI